MTKTGMLSRALGSVRLALVSATALLLTLFANDASAVSDNVRLLYANPYSAGGSDYVDVYVHVKNVGVSATRYVAIHYNDGTPSWADARTWPPPTPPLPAPPAPSQCYDYGDHSVCHIRVAGRSNLEFAVKYVVQVGGTWESYWDNNDGANYKVEPYPGGGGFIPGVVGYNVGLQNVQITDDTWAGGPASLVTLDVAVQNLSYNKRVGVRFSINGNPWQDVDCYYVSAMSTGTGTGLIETWRVLIGRQPRFSGSFIRFALYCKNLDWGTEYWDNNFTQDYSMSLASDGVMY